MIADGKQLILNELRPAFECVCGVTWDKNYYRDGILKGTYHICLKRKGHGKLHKCACGCVHCEEKEEKQNDKHGRSMGKNNESAYTG